MLEDKPSLAEDLGILKVANVRLSAKSNIPKLQSTSYRCRQLLGFLPNGMENNEIIRKEWVDKIIEFLNTKVQWQYETMFRFKADLTSVSDGKVCSSLDECLLNEDIGGFVHTCLYNDPNAIKNNKEIMKNIFGHEENLENGESILLSNWNAWEPDE